MPKTADPQPDPLADLREPEPEANHGPAPVQGKAADSQQGRVAAIITAWHADPIAASYGHAGGNCACRYLATAALAALDA